MTNHLSEEITIDQPPKQTISVLVVDDDDLFLRFCNRMLEREQFTVHTADNGNEALAMAADHSYDVVLVETTGVGQTETDVRHVADTVLLVVQPGSGDGGGMNVYVRELASALSHAGGRSTVFTRRVDPDTPTVVDVTSSWNGLTPLTPSQGYW